MLIGAVLPAASELVMLYAGAVAAGVFTSAHHVSLFGAKFGFGAGAFVVMSLAGTLGYLAGAIVGWWGRARSSAGGAGCAAAGRCSSLAAACCTSHPTGSTARSAGSSAGATSACCS